MALLDQKIVQHPDVAKSSGVLVNYNFIFRYTKDEITLVLYLLQAYDLVQGSLVSSISIPPPITLLVAS